MKRKNKVFLIIISAILVVTIVCFSTVYFLFLHRYKGKNVIDEWNVTDEFNIDDIATIKKEKDKEFVILNLADVQMCDLENFFNMGIIKKEIEYLVEEVKPDLITLTGDQTWSNENLISLKSLISWLDSFKIPYAPVFGNHDYGNTKNSSVLDLNACCDLYEKGKYSLFKRGPSNLDALGNYVINVTEDDKIYKTLYMLDLGYGDEITDMQKEWFKWNAEGIRAANGGEYTEGMCFFHKPLPEYAYAYRQYVSGSPTVRALGDVYVYYSLYGSLQNGFFDEAKDRNVKDFVCGHQHGNSFTLLYDDVRLTFALKTGELGGYCDDGETYLSGATYFVLDGGETTVKTIYVDKDKFHINGSENVLE